MTVIAWDGKALAADRRAVNCGLARTVCKIERVKGALVGMSGDHGVAAEMLKWFTSGGEFPAKARDDIAAELAGAATSTSSSVRRGSFAVRFSTARGD